MNTLLEQLGFIEQPKDENLTHDAVTYNGNPSFSTIGTPHLDFYAGVTRQSSVEAIRTLAENCLNENTRLALVTFFQKRNCRDGAGERLPFIIAMKAVPNDLRRRLYPLIPQYGYWKDLLQLARTIPEDRDHIAELFAKQLLANMASLQIPNVRSDYNLEKWLPSKKGEDDREWRAVGMIISKFNNLTKDLAKSFCFKKDIVNQLEYELKTRIKKIDSSISIIFQDRKFTLEQTTPGESITPGGEGGEGGEEGADKKIQELVTRYNYILEKGNRVKAITSLTDETYRKWCSYQRAHRQVVEHYTSTDNWDLIDYSNVPSIAFDRTKKQFKEHDESRFSSFIEKVKSGETKINVGRVMPFELVSQPSSEIRDEQWRAVVEETKQFYSEVSLESPFHPKNTIHVCDVSASMKGVYGVYGLLRPNNVIPMDVSKSMGMLMSEVGERDFYTFSGDPKRYSPNWSSLTEALKTLKDPNYNTDLKKLIDRIHDDCMLEADKKMVSPSEVIPGSIIIYTDGGFDSMCKMKPVSALEYLQGKFGQYRKVPIFVFWNVAGNTNDFQVKEHVKGVVQLSGFSKDLYKTFTRITDPDQISPEFFFRADVLSEVYQPVLQVYDMYIQEGVV